MFALLGYTSSAAAGATNADLTALTDPDFTQRNGHYTFTERYRLLAACDIGANDTTASLLTPTWNAISRFNISPPTRSATPVSRGWLDLFMQMQPPIPLNEEFQFQTSNDAGAPVRTNGVLWIGTEDWNRNLPSGIMPFEIRCTAAATGVANAWSGATAITFEQSLRGGVYSICGAYFQGAGCIAARVIFPRQRLYQGRKLRPGHLVQNAVGDFPPMLGQYQSTIFGEWGRFHTFEPPQLEVWANAAGAVTIECRFRLVYLGTELSLLESGSLTI